MKTSLGRLHNISEVEEERISKLKGGLIEIV